MVILKSDLGDNVLAIYDKTAQEPFVVINNNFNNAGTIEAIEDSPNQKGIIYTGQ
jgi:hypothetical protein